MPSHYDNLKKKQLEQAKRFAKQAQRRPTGETVSNIRSAVSELGQSIAGTPKQSGRLPDPSAGLMGEARRKLRAGISRAPQDTQRNQGGAGGEQAGAGEVLGGDQQRQDYIPPSERTPGQQQRAFQRVANVAHPFSQGDVPSPESRVGAFNARGERIPVTYRRGGKTFDESGRARSVYDQLKTLRSLREQGRRDRLERIAAEPPSLRQGLDSFLQAAGRRRFAQRRLSELEERDLQRENIQARLGGSAISAAQAAQAAAAKQDLAERKFALDVNKYRGTEQQRAFERGLDQARLAETIRGRVGREGLREQEIAGTERGRQLSTMRTLAGQETDLEQRMFLQSSPTYRRLFASTLPPDLQAEVKRNPELLDQILEQFLAEEE